MFIMQKARIPNFVRMDSCYDSRGSLDDITSQSHVQQRRMVVMSEIEEQERKVVNEFCHLLEKSKQLFNGLRDLPQYGHKQWQPYFGKTFDVYTKLWKFQQQHRAILDVKYGLKRWQIGEIASKIGQLYYHYYLRTSETNYLSEAFSFYQAIRTRGYYAKANKEERCDLMVKKLRYFARFVVVCLLLKKMKLVRDLVKDLSKHIEEYTNVYEPDDCIEWQLGLSEIKAFLEADNLTTVIDVDNHPIIISHRLNPLNTPPAEKVSGIHFSLQEVLIVGNVQDQIKFSELTLDMFRMLQALEREPQDESSQRASGMRPQFGSATLCGPGGSIPPLTSASESAQRLSRDNPHKYLLYKPNIHQLLVFLASGFKELPPNGVLLLYLSADGSFGPASSQYPGGAGAGPGAFYPGIPSGYAEGGVACNPRCPDASAIPLSRQMTAAMENALDTTCLHPGDLHVFLRKPFLLIVDSDNSRPFAQLPRMFGQPLLVLMSPEEAPPPFQQQQQQHGSLFTMFLHCPLTALCLISNIIEMPLQIWDKAQTGVDRFLMEASRILPRCRNIDPVFVHFLVDDFMRLLILRFVFCSVLLRMHRLFRGGTYSPSSHPPLPDPDLLEHPTLRRVVHEIAITLDIRSHFTEIEDHE